MVIAQDLLENVSNLLQGWQAELNDRNVFTSYVTLSTVRMVSTFEAWTSCYQAPNKRDADDRNLLTKDGGDYQR